MEIENLDSETKTTVHAAAGPPPKPWNPPPGLKFPCPFDTCKHEVSKCSEFFNLTPLDRWEKIEKIRMCYSCLKPKTVGKGKKCNNVGSVPEVFKMCSLCFVGGIKGFGSVQFIFL